MFVVKADTAEEFRAEIVKWLEDQNQRAQARMRQAPRMRDTRFHSGEHSAFESTLQFCKELHIEGKSDADAG